MFVVPPPPLKAAQRVDRKELSDRVRFLRLETRNLIA